MILKFQRSSEADHIPDGSVARSMGCAKQRLAQAKPFSPVRVKNAPGPYHRPLEMLLAELIRQNLEAPWTQAFRKWIMPFQATASRSASLGTFAPTPRRTTLKNRTHSAGWGCGHGFSQFLLESGQKL